MPMIPMPEAPTAPTLGRASSAALPGGFISTELSPFVSTGGGIMGQDPYQLSIAGEYGSRLGRHMFLKGPEEQRNIMAGIRTQRLNDYVSSRLAEGFTQTNRNRLEKTEGGYKTYIDINWDTGNIDSNSEALRQATSTPVVNYKDPISTLNKMMAGTSNTVEGLQQKEKLAGIQANYLAGAYGAKTSPKYVIPKGTQGLITDLEISEPLAIKLAQEGVIPVISEGYTGQVRNVISAGDAAKMAAFSLPTAVSKSSSSSSKSSSGGGGGISTSKLVSSPITSTSPTIAKTISNISSSSSGSSSYKSYTAPVSQQISSKLNTPSSSSSVVSKVNASLPSAFSGSSAFTAPKSTPSMSSAFTSAPKASTPAKASTPSSSSFSGISSAIGKAVSSIFGGKK